MKNDKKEVTETKKNEKKKFDWKKFGADLGTTCLTAFVTGMFMFAGQKALDNTLFKKK